MLVENRRLPEVQQCSGVQTVLVEQRRIHPVLEAYTNGNRQIGVKQETVSRTDIFMSPSSTCRAKNRSKVV